MDVRLTVIGSSPAWPNPGGACSGYLVEGPGRLLVDCGPGVLAKLREREPWPRIDAIVLTHLHLDHWGDLVPWVWGTLYGPGVEAPRPELHVYRGAPEALASTLSQLGGAGLLERVFDVREYDEGVPFEVAGFRLRALGVPHYDERSHALRIEADGAALAYSGDAGPCDALVEIARDVDLFLCEATLERGADDGELRGHLAADEAVALAEAAGARRLLLTHRPVERALPAGLELVYDGLAIELR
jgi:ribonuclease BN (tRNA processing enzyme)